MKKIIHKQILVAIETDSTRYHGELACRPKLLDKAASEQVLAHLSSDLEQLFPTISRCSLTMAGALFDQTQVLRLGYPAFTALESMMLSSFAKQDYQPRLLSLGADAGRMPMEDLQPLENIPPGLLQTLPVLVSGPAGEVDALFEEMEHQFLETGQLSAHSSKGLEAGFGVRVTHARFMTLADLYTLLRMQLEHFGFLPLWELLDAALNDQAEAMTVEGNGGQRFAWRDGAVHARFETFDYWANLGAGCTQPSDHQFLAGAYADWTREYRQYLTTLEAHAVSVIQHLPQQRDVALQGSYLVETSITEAPENAAKVTEHSAADLGTIAVSVVDGERLLNHYPIKSIGLNELHASIRAAGFASGGVSFPGTIRYGAKSRRLEPDLLPRQPP